MLCPPFDESRHLVEMQLIVYCRYTKGTTDRHLCTVSTTLSNTVCYCLIPTHSDVQRTLETVTAPIQPGSSSELDTCWKSHHSAHNHQEIRWVEEILTTLDGWKPINNGKNHLSTGAGFLPSTVSRVNSRWPAQLMIAMLPPGFLATLRSLCRCRGKALNFHVCRRTSFPVTLCDLACHVSQKNTQEPT